MGDVIFLLLIEAVKGLCYGMGWLIKRAMHLPISANGRIEKAIGAAAWVASAAVIAVYLRLG